MPEGTFLVVVGVLLVLIFEFYNGLNDAANSIATIVSTRVLTPLQAVAWAAFFNFAAAFLFELHVAKTIGRGMVIPEAITMGVIYAGLISAILWIGAATRFGLPVSASHALIGGVGGAAIAKVGVSVIVASGWTKVCAFIVLAPLIGMTLGGVFMVIVLWMWREAPPEFYSRWFRRLQLVSAAAFSLGHGTNDAQKGMGIIALLLFTSGRYPTLTIPFWVVIACHTSIALGTLLGGWKVIKTLGMRLSELRPVGGFCAETAGALTLMGTAALGIPVSTTHTIAGSIMGVGAVRRLTSVRWGVARPIVWAWVLTLPCTMLAAAACYHLLIRWVLV